MPEKIKTHNMESEVGVQDFVLLDEVTHERFMENIKIRYVHVLCVSVQSVLFVFFLKIFLVCVFFFFLSI